MEKKEVKKRIGGRTGDAVANKKIKLKDQDNETFEDYFTPSYSNSDISHLPLNSNLQMNSSAINSNVPKMSTSFKNMGSISKENLSRISSFSKPISYQLQGRASDFIENAMKETKVLNKSQDHETPSKCKKSYARCRRTADSLLAGKEIRVINEEENFHDCWTETSGIDTQSVYSNKSIIVSKSLANNTKSSNFSRSSTVSSSTSSPKVIRNKQKDNSYKSNSSISRKNTKNNSPKNDNQNQEKIQHERSCDIQIPSPARNSKISSSPKSTSKGYQLQGTASDFIENVKKETQALNKSQGRRTSKSKKSYVRCWRTADSVLAGKEIRVINGEENFHDCRTETSGIDTQSVNSNEIIVSKLLAYNTKSSNFSRSSTVCSSALSPTVITNKQNDKRYKSNSSISISGENTRNNSPKKDNQSQEKSQHEKSCDNQIPSSARNRKKLSSLESPIQRKKNAQQIHAEYQLVHGKTLNSSKVDNMEIATKSSQSQQYSTNGSSNSEGRIKSLSPVLNSAIPVSRNIKQRAGHARSVSSPVSAVRKQDSQLRRSKRNRIAPLQSWRNEARFFHWKNGELVDIVYNKGCPEDTTSVDIIAKILQYSSTYQKRQKESTLKENTDNLKQIREAIDKIPVINPNTGDEELVYLQRPYKTLLWTVPPSQYPDNPSFTMTKCISSEQVAFGYIDIGVRKKKEEQYTPVNITFNVIHGRVKMCINKYTLTLKEKDTGIVPAGNTYSIYNYGKCDALLYFCNFKAPLFEYQLSENPQNED